MISIAAPLLGEEETAAVLHVLNSGQLAQGEQVALFEQRFAQFCQVPYAIAVSSGTAALHLALLAHGIGPGDEVITTAFTFAATANAILLVGATPVFVDIDAETYTIDPVLIKAALTSRTRAIMPVHLYGHPCDMPTIMQIARDHGLLVIEDACQAHAATIEGKTVGSFSTGCFSFYPTKNMTTGEGGMVTTHDPVIAEHIRLLRNQGQAQRYVQTTLGYNQRMTNLQAALGLAQLPKLERFTERRIANARFLTEGLGEFVKTPGTRPGYRHVYHQYTIQVPEEQRNKWATTLNEHGIGTGIYYPLPIYAQPFYRASPSLFRLAQPTNMRRATATSLPITEIAARQVLSLPVHPALSETDLTTIVREVLALCQ
ncbi:MAG TPA: DegT/DnrJ/EryC1/StrS aminotransferase family protein [Ktedonobacteraceae bacterium]|nr:DegT/DnrJ/EryC1/StrS aminotransferase family protein [Ktedonobacteraceae bacterium]